MPIAAVLSLTELIANTRGAVVLSPVVAGCVHMLCCLHSGDYVRTGGGLKGWSGYFEAFYRKSYILDSRRRFVYSIRYNRAARVLGLYHARS